MYEHINAGCLERWLSDPADFRYDFLRQCQFLCKAVGYSFTFDGEAFRIIHENWRAQCEYWKKERVAQDADGLSHLKVLAILLHQLASLEWVKQLTEFDPAEDGLEKAFAGTPAEREEVRKDINAGRGTYLGFQFIILVMNWFEVARPDCREEFHFRLTSDIEHDFMHYLLSEGATDVAVYLFLKALYARDCDCPN